MKNIEDLVPNKIVKELEKDPIFKQKCVEEFLFLIKDYGFEKITIEDFEKGSIITFAPKRAMYPKVCIEYEMGTLPEVKIHQHLNITKALSQQNNLIDYHAHNELREIVQGKITSVDDYIMRLGKVWETKRDQISEEIRRALEVLSEETQNFLSMNPKFASKV